MQLPRHAEPYTMWMKGSGPEVVRLVAGALRTATGHIDDDDYRVRLAALPEAVAVLDAALAVLDGGDRATCEAAIQAACDAGHSHAVTGKSSRAWGERGYASFRAETRKEARQSLAAACRSESRSHLLYAAAALGRAALVAAAPLNAEDLCKQCDRFLGLPIAHRGEEPTAALATGRQGCNFYLEVERAYAGVSHGDPTPDWRSISA